MGTLAFARAVVQEVVSHPELEGVLQLSSADEVFLKLFAVELLYSGYSEEIIDLRNFEDRTTGLIRVQELLVAFDPDEGRGWNVRAEQYGTLMLRAGSLGIRGVVRAEEFVAWPVYFLAFGRAVRGRVTLRTVFGVRRIADCTWRSHDIDVELRAEADLGTLEIF